MPMDDKVAALAARHLDGPAPTPAPDGSGAPMPGAPQGAPGASPQGAPAQDSDAEKTIAAASPDTEDDRMGDNPIVYEVDFGGSKRPLTPEQIRSTFERYSALNHKNAEMKPIMEVVDAMMKGNPNASPRQIAEGLIAMAKSGQSAPSTFGEAEQAASMNAQAEPPKTNEEVEAALKKWEEDNAAALPPGYREFMMGQNTGNQTMTQMQQQMQQMQQMLGSVLQRSQGVVDAARDNAGQVKGEQIKQVQAQIGTNLDRAQMSLALPDESANDFMVFAAERGYTMEDFIDPDLTHRVMSDFKNTKDSPEMDRLRNIAKRRAAFTGSVGSTPSAGGSPSAGDEGDGRLGQLAARARGRLNPG